ncbi:hypothetical protein WOLCODRAFT_68894 [Wolfiporia cocos MD-104 SS10]|uniref:HAT C-terminal dimerisation domain-containing protein n=1 Tax=Wolfiporia cocos (strain MD-104) TaxID=742152 RepID=A0A2H3JC54_WOLCO|nr:hypothetical protein WOLCODRAFT_68894 [Wolfiporia cocos MD-104 SS10]
MPLVCCTHICDSPIAHSFLAIPAASVAVEHLSLSSYHLCVNAHISLKAKTITQTMCIWQWLCEYMTELA